MSHSYRSTYSIGSFLSNLNFGNPEFIFDSNGNYLPEYQIDQVAITEQFAPLVKFDMTMKNSIKRFEFILKVSPIMGQFVISLNFKE